MAHILIIDDNAMLCDTCATIIQSYGHKVDCAYTLKKSLELISKDSYDLVFLDVNLPDGNGLDKISVFKEAQNSPEVIIITGEGNKDGAELAIRSGSWDYIQKPLTMEKIYLPLIRVLQYREEKARRKTPLILKRERIIGNSPEINRCLGLVAKAAVTDANVLIKGETGTGKELFAKAIHENSPRSGNSFVVVDCAALPENLIESTLFGHEKGAFTGAVRSREGLIKEADRGTLFLDEIGELPLQQQRAFLRVLEGHSFRPVGSKSDRFSNFRLISATNRDMDEMIRAGKFREDLLFRLQSLTISIPPLRERSGDIKDIVSYYIIKLSNKYGSVQKGYSSDFMETISRYKWPGNVRELIHAMESALSESSDDPTLYPIHLPNEIRARLIREAVTNSDKGPDDHRKNRDTSESFVPFKTLMESTERKYFQDLIQHTRGDIKKICRISGISRSKVYERFKKYNLSKSLS